MDPEIGDQWPQQQATTCVQVSPKVGDRVRTADGRKFASTNWTLNPGAIATVKSVEGEGFFKLMNPEGNVSPTILRKWFVYVEDESPNQNPNYLQGKSAPSGRLSGAPRMVGMPPDDGNEVSPVRESPLEVDLPYMEEREGDIQLAYPEDPEEEPGNKDRSTAGDQDIAEETRGFLCFPATSCGRNGCAGEIQAGP